MYTIYTKIEQKNERYGGSFIKDYSNVKKLIFSQRDSQSFSEIFFQIDLCFPESNDAYVVDAVVTIMHDFFAKIFSSSSIDFKKYFSKGEGYYYAGLKRMIAYIDVSDSKIPLNNDNELVYSILASLRRESPAKVVWLKSNPIASDFMNTARNADMEKIENVINSLFPFKNFIVKPEYYAVNILSMSKHTYKLPFAVSKQVFELYVKAASAMSGNVRPETKLKDVAVIPNKIPLHASSSRFQHDNAAINIVAKYSNSREIIDIVADVFYEKFKLIDMNFSYRSATAKDFLKYLQENVTSDINKINQDRVLNALRLMSLLVSKSKSECFDMSTTIPFSADATTLRSVSNNSYMTKILVDWLTDLEDGTSNFDQLKEVVGLLSGKSWIKSSYNLDKCYEKILEVSKNPKDFPNFVMTTLAYISETEGNTSSDAPVLNFESMARSNNKVLTLEEWINWLNISQEGSNDNIPLSWKLPLAINFDTN